MKIFTAILLALVLFTSSGCTVISYDRPFPKFTWYWSAEAREQRRAEAAPMLPPL